MRKDLNYPKLLAMLGNRSSRRGRAFPAIISKSRPSRLLNRERVTQLLLDNKGYSLVSERTAAGKLAPGLARLFLLTRQKW
jgi:hypothetical protein